MQFLCFPVLVLLFSHVLSLMVASVSRQVQKQVPYLLNAFGIDEPTQNGYYGGVVAAPVFRDVVSNALRILDIPPDDLPTLVQSRDQEGA